MRICLWAGAGAGKSTVAEGVSHHLKKLGHKVDLVQEWVKPWAYMGRVPKSFEPALITISQLHLEDFLLNNGVQHIITDSPVMMSLVYCKKYGFEAWPELLALVRKFEDKFPSYNIFLDREGVPYKTEGRYQTYEEALEFDRLIRDFMDEQGVSYTSKCSTDMDGILTLAELAVRWGTNN